MVQLQRPPYVFMGGRISEISSVKKVAIDFFSSRAAAAQGLETKIFDDWQPELDEVLESLPETEIFPHELFRLLMKMPSAKRRQSIVIMERGAPVALAGLKNEFGYWEPVTQWIVPGVLFPAKENYIARVIAALGLEMKVAWWRWETAPPQIRWMKNLLSAPAYAMRCAQDFEDYWRTTDALKLLSVGRTRCRGLELGINLPGSTEWTIKKWAKRWRPKGFAEKPDLADRLLVAKYLERRGLYYTFSLLDKGKIRCAYGCPIHRNDIVLQYLYSAKPLAPAVLFELVCYWGREMGFKKVDLGGQMELFKKTSVGEKENWAPKDGVKCEFDISPFFHRNVRKRTLQLMHGARGKLSRRFKKPARVSRYSH